LANAYFMKGDYVNSFINHEKALNIRKSINDKVGVSASLNNIGNIYYSQGDYPKALEYQFQSLKIEEELGNQQGIAKSLNNIGAIFFNQKYFAKALEYYTKSLEIKEKLNDKPAIAATLNNIGRSYLRLEQFKEAYKVLSHSLAIRRELNDKNGIANTLGSIGEMYDKTKEYEKAIVAFKEAIKIKKEINDKFGLSENLSSIATAYRHMNNIPQAIIYAREGLKISQEIQALLPMAEAAGNLYFCLKEIGSYKEALDIKQIEVDARDSMYSESKNKELGKLQSNYDLYKKQKEIELLEKDNILKKKNAESFRLYTIILGGGFFSILALAFVLMRNNRQKQRTNKILAEQKLEISEKNEELNQTNEEIRTTLELVEKQKEVIEDKNMEITASIRYARRIQTAVLPSDELLQNTFRESFILYKPRDIVSGDFCWFKQIDNKILLAVADCTGHGVPGAFMSMLGITLLNDIVRRNIDFAANLVLNELRTDVKSALGQTGKKDEQKDGMDIAFCIIDLENKKLQYAGANNTMLLVRKNINDCEHAHDMQNCDSRSFLENCDRCSPLHELKGDRMPIGIYIAEKESFTNYCVSLKEGDNLYMYSDGYVDQFGGPDGRKFLIRSFKDLVLSVQSIPMQEQKQIFEQTLETWIGNREQVDDILVVGVSV